MKLVFKKFNQASHKQALKYFFFSDFFD